MRAYETLSDPARRKAYDKQWVHIRTRQSLQKSEETPGATGAANQEKRETEAAEAKRETREAEDKLKEQTSQAEEVMREQKENEALQKRIEKMEEHRPAFEGLIPKVTRTSWLLGEELRQLRKQDYEESKKDKKMTSWWAHMNAFINGMSGETEEEHQQRENKRLQRLASLRATEDKLSRTKVNLRDLTNALLDVKCELEEEKTKIQERERAKAAKQEEGPRKEKEATKRAEEQQERKTAATYEAVQAMKKKGRSCKGESCT